MTDRNNPERRIWECPVCLSLNSWNLQDAERAESLLRLEPDSIAVCHGSAFDNRCGNCGANLVHEDSPILAECYAHCA